MEGSRHDAGQGHREIEPRLFETLRALRCAHSRAAIRRQLLHPNFATCQRWERRTLVLFSRTIQRRMRSEDWFADEVRWDERICNIADEVVKR